MAAAKQSRRMMFRPEEIFHLAACVKAILPNCLNRGGWPLVEDRYNKERQSDWPTRDQNTLRSKYSRLCRRASDLRSRGQHVPPMFLALLEAKEFVASSQEGRGIIYGDETAMDMENDAAADAATDADVDADAEPDMTGFAGAVEPLIETPNSSLPSGVGKLVTHETGRAARREAPPAPTWRADAFVDSRDYVEDDTPAAPDDDDGDASVYSESDESDSAPPAKKRSAPAAGAAPGTSSGSKYQPPRFHNGEINLLTRLAKETAGMPRPKDYWIHMAVRYNEQRQPEWPLRTASALRKKYYDEVYGRIGPCSRVGQGAKRGGKKPATGTPRPRLVNTNRAVARSSITHPSLSAWEAVPARESFAPLTAHDAMAPLASGGLTTMLDYDEIDGVRFVASPFSESHATVCPPALPAPNLTGPAPAGTRPRSNSMPPPPKRVAFVTPGTDDASDARPGSAFSPAIASSVAAAGPGSAEHLGSRPPSGLRVDSRPANGPPKLGGPAGQLFHASEFALAAAAAALDAVGSIGRDQPAEPPTPPAAHVAVPVPIVPLAAPLPAPAHVPVLLPSARLPPAPPLLPVSTHLLPATTPLMHAARLPPAPPLMSAMMPPVPPLVPVPTHMNLSLPAAAHMNLSLPSAVPASLSLPASTHMYLSLPTAAHMDVPLPLPLPAVPNMNLPVATHANIDLASVRSGGVP
eukprot:m.232709 g.232709  ORF g.232709 m.232709 type:complete len:694 (+) comp12398_c0_seq1:251-2332(+)